MLIAHFDTSIDERIFSLHISGHANTDEVGKDLVCASASILAYTIARDVEINEEIGVLDDVEIRLEPGDTLIKCHCLSEKAYAYMRRAFWVISNGFLLLQEDYPENVKAIVW